MDSQTHRLKEALNHIGAKSLAFASAAIIAATVVAALVGNNIYVTEKRVLRQQGEINAKESAREYDRCLHTRSDIVTVVGYAVDTMIASGERNGATAQY